MKLSLVLGGNIPFWDLFAGEYHSTTDCLLALSASYSAWLAVENMRPRVSNLHKSHPSRAELSRAANVACIMTV